MRTLLISFSLVLRLVAQSPLHCAGDPLPPQITSPTLVTGQATCFHELLSGSSRIELNVTADSHLRWSQFAIGEGDVLEFQFQDGASAVLNQFDGARSILGGTILARGGRLGLLSSEGTLSLQETTRIEAQSLLISNHRLLEPSAFLRGEAYQLSSPESARLTLRGEISTRDQLVVTSSGLLTASNARITSSDGSIALGAGDSLSVDPSSRMPITNASSNVSSLSVNAPLQAGQSIQLDATRGVLLGNAISTTAPTGRIYVRVDQDGLIETQGNPLPVTGEAIFTGPVSEAATLIFPNEGDNASSAVPAMSQLPTLKRSSRKANYQSAPVHVRSGQKMTSTQAAQPQEKVIPQKRRIALRSSSFFGLRSSSKK